MNEVTSESTSIKKTKKLRRAAGGAVILIVLGFLFLGRNFGVVSWNPWSIIWRFWPIFLIAAGLEMLWGATLVGKVIKFVISVSIFLGVIFAIFWWANPTYMNLWANKIGIYLPQIPGFSRVAVYQTKNISIDNTLLSNKPVKIRDVIVDIGAGIVNLNDNSGKYFQLSESYPKQGYEPQLMWDLTDQTLTVSLIDANSHWLLGENKYDFSLGNDDIKTDFDFQLGSGKANLDFSNTVLDQASFDVGAGFADITFSDKSLPSQPVPVEVGAGTVNIKLPKDVSIKVTYDVGVGQLMINGTNVGNEGTYQSPEYDNAPKKVEFTVDVGAGQVNFEQ